MKPYETYDVIAFAQDQSFIRWVQDKDEANNLFWEQWVQEHPEKSALIEEARQMVHSMKFKEKELTDTDKDNLWNAIAEVSFEQEANKRPVRLISRRWSMAYAAAFLVLVIGTLAWAILFTDTNVSTGKAIVKAHTLPGNSIVELSASTKITYNKRGWQNERQVTMKGEARFAVTKGNRFVINTDLGQIEVLGTRFNVFSREDRLEVNCFSGRVRVTSKDNQEVILTKGESVVFKDETMKSETFNVEEKKIWVHGYFEYEDATFREVFDEMERQFDIVIRAPDEIATLSYSGFFENYSLEAAFETVCFTQGLDWVGVRKNIYEIRKK